MREITDELMGRVVFICAGEIKSSLPYESIALLPRVGEVCTFQTQDEAGAVAVEFSGLVRRVEHVTQSSRAWPIITRDCVVVMLEQL